MFGIYKKYLKYKLILILKDMLINYNKEKEHYIKRENEWKNKNFTVKCIRSEIFEKRRKEQIEWLHQQWLINHYKHEAITEAIETIQNL